MSDKSNPAGQVILLPSGGGVVKGLGETLFPDCTPEQDRHDPDSHHRYEFAYPVNRAAQKVTADWNAT